MTFAAGAVDRPILPRSCNKPVQATALLAVGWAPRTPAELFIGAGSLNGEDGHRQLVASMLAAAGLGPDDLGCPPALPQHEPTKGRGAVALKMDDGGVRGRAPALNAALLRLGLPAEVLAPWLQSSVTGGDRVVGEVHASALLTA